MRVCRMEPNGNGGRSWGRVLVQFVEYYSHLSICYLLLWPGFTHTLFVNNEFDLNSVKCDRNWRDRITLEFSTAQETET